MRYATKIGNIKFPEFSGIRCLMMPYIQGEIDSVPEEYNTYKDIIQTVFVRKGDIGFLTIDESVIPETGIQRGARSKFGRALHTEAGLHNGRLGWGGSLGWGDRRLVSLDPGTEFLIANNIDKSCAVWDAIHPDTSLDGDIGDCADQYPYEDAIILDAGEVYKIGVLTPHEGLPVSGYDKRQFLRIVGKGVIGREEYFTENPLLKI